MDLMRGHDTERAHAAAIDVAELMIHLRQYHTGKER